MAGLRVSTKTNATLTLIGLIAFIFSGTVAALSYPGGTHWQRAGLGFSWTTFWCDLLRPVALNGEPNAGGARAAQVALLALALSLGPFFALAPPLLDVRGMRRTLLFVGAYAGRIGLILVAAGTGRMSPAVHDWSIIIGAPLGLLALGAVVVWSLRLGPAIRWVGVTSLILGTWNLAQYAREFLFLTPSWPGLPIVQKATTLAVVTFIVLFSAKGLEREQ